MQKTLNQLTLISRQSQEEKRKDLCEAVKNAVCKRETSSDTWTLPSPHAYFRFNPRQFVRDYLRKVDRLVLNHLVSLSKKYKHIFQSQSTIGRAIGYTREEVCRSVRRLQAYGILRTIYRHWQPSIYKLTSLLSMKRVINKISSFITSLRTCVKKNLTQLDSLVSSKLNSYRKPCTCSYLTYNSKRPVMTKDDIAARVKAIDEISNTIDLSRYGKANLSIFPDSALRVAHDQLIKSLKKGVNIKNTFAYLHALAHKATQEQNLTLNYSLFERYEFSTSEKNPLNSKTITMPTCRATPKEERSMHERNQVWVKPEYNCDYEEEVRRYHEPNKIEGFREAMANLVRLLGEEEAHKNFESFKMRFTKKAIECANN